MHAVHDLLHGPHQARRPGVVTLSRTEFRGACARLMSIAEQERHPDFLVGIPTGGMHVACAMLEAARDLPVYPLSCRRPSTRQKRNPLVRGMIASLPRPVADQMRLWEHAMLANHAPGPGRKAAYELAEEELDSLAAAMRSAGPRPAVLVVDDAVDTGTTLSLVMDAIHGCAPAGAHIRSAAIVQTTAHPAITPDYVLYQNQLCRFPWSLDAIAMNRS